jgi:hypothetical protein
MRRLRERQKAKANGPILFERQDWKLFVDPATLPQKAGCEPNQIGRAILKELSDNAADSGGSVMVVGDEYRCTVADNGPGLAESDIVRLFSINRPLLSSKLKRLPTRGAIGNGLRVVVGAIAAYDGTISVTSRGRIYDLGHNPVTGVTEVRASAPALATNGLNVALRFPRPMFKMHDFNRVREAVEFAGRQYQGPSLPSWYSPQAICDLLTAAQDTSPAAVIEVHSPRLIIARSPAAP